MKKCRRFIAVVITAILLLGMTITVSAKEETVQEHYKYMLESLTEDIIYIEDNSSSMRNTFCYEKSVIDYHLSETSFTAEYINNTNRIWSGVNYAAANYDTMVFVSDLWNTSDMALKPASNKKMAIMVPYWSEDEEAVSHIEDVIWNEILPQWSYSTIIIIYLDGCIDIYDQTKLC